MKHIKKIEELKKSTYYSAARKLKEIGGRSKIDRAEKLIDFAKSHGEEYDVHNLHYHEFTILNDDGYVISDYKIRKSGSRSYITLIMYNEKRDKKSISAEFTYYGSDGWATRSDNDFDIETIEYDELWLNFYNSKEELSDCVPGFLFRNRKDAIEFKKFIIEVFDNTKYSKFTRIIEVFKKVSINKLTKV